jgi:lysyl-tRNA synthetase class 2
MSDQENFEQNIEDLSEQKRIRREKLQNLKENGRDPFLLTRFERTHTSAQIVAGFEALEGKAVSVAGRMISKRIMGKAA